MRGHFIITDDRAIDLIEEGEIEGFRAGDRVRFSDECFERFRGRLGTVRGFDKHGQVWTQPDGLTGCTRTPRDVAKAHLINLTDR